MSDLTGKEMRDHFKTMNRITGGHAGKIVKKEIAKKMPKFKQPYERLVPTAKKFKTKMEFLSHLAGEGYKKHKDTLKEIKTGDSDLAWNKSRGVGINGKKIK